MIINTLFFREVEWRSKKRRRSCLWLRLLFREENPKKDGRGCCKYVVSRSGAAILHQQGASQSSFVTFNQKAGIAIRSGVRIYGFLFRESEDQRLTVLSVPLQLHPWH